MLIPSIDLLGGRIVQLVQGERLAIASDDIHGWIRRFDRFEKVQLIDLDAAKGTGSNDPLIEMICARLRCRVGGGIRSVARASELLARGAAKVILGSALFRDGQPDTEMAGSMTRAIGRERLIAAVDARGGHVVIHGWRTVLEVTPVEAIRMLEPFVGEFLYTHVDTEGLMKGIDRAAVQQLRDATACALTVAGGISTHEEIEWLAGLGVDAVVGMAVYSGRLEI